MNNKVPLRILAERISAQTGCDVDAAQTFVKTLFGVVADEILNGSSVSVGGLGTFTGSPNPDEPVRLIVESGLADELNAPFSMFRSVEVDNNITPDDLETIGKDQDENRTKENITAGDVDIVVEEMSEKADEEVTSEKIDTVVEESVKPITAVPQSEICDETTDDCVADESVDSGETDESIGSDESEEQHLPDLNEPEAITPEETQIMVDSSTIPEDEEEYAEYYEEPKSRFWPGFFIGLISGLIIGALCFVGYILYFVETGTKLF